MDLLNRSEALLQELLPFVVQQVQKKVNQISVIESRQTWSGFFFGI
jgi:hypothetical protein